MRSVSQGVAALLGVGIASISNIAMSSTSFAVAQARDLSQVEIEDVFICLV